MQDDDRLRLEYEWRSPLPSRKRSDYAALALAVSALVRLATWLAVLVMA